MSAADNNSALYFALMNEIGIIEQLSRALFEARLPEGFGMPHFKVLNHLVRLGDGRTPLEIARAFQVPKTSLTHTLAGLEKADLIRFVPNPKDGRSKSILLTEAGRRFREEAIGRLGPVVERLSEAVAPDRVRAILPELAEIRAYLDANRDM